MTGEPIDPAVVEQAAARVWERLSPGRSRPPAGSPSRAGGCRYRRPPAASRGCDDFQALIPAYLRGELSPARALLVEDHTRSCVPCRRALREAREGKGDGGPSGRSRPSSPAATAAGVA